jgi:hypothetical protein
VKKKNEEDQEDLGEEEDNRKGTFWDDMVVTAE